MTYTKSEVYSILTDLLGENPEGIFIPSSEYEYGFSESPTMSKMNENETWAVEEIEGFELCRGATKVVIRPVNADYVIKLNITGTYLTEEECEIAGLKYPYIDRHSSYDTLDYENAIYEELPDELRSIIKPNIYLGEYCGISIYIQEKIKYTYQEDSYSAEIRFSEISDNKKDFIKTVLTKSKPAGWSKNSTLFPEEFVADMVSKFGEKKTEKILMQLKDSCIYDLNFYNFGYDKEGFPCLFDIGGFQEDEFFDQDIDYYNTDWGILEWIEK